jgi:hypothetical protein
MGSKIQPKNIHLDLKRRTNVRFSFIAQFSNIISDFTDKSLIRFKQGKAKHKTDYHVWSRRPLTSQLLNYAAFDVAALRPIVHVFVTNLELWRWGAWLGVISKSGMTTYPRHRTCYHCLV